MVRDTVIRRALLCEVIGFAAVLVLLWVNEFMDLPNRLFGTGPTPANWSECLFESAAVGFLGFLVVISSSSLLVRIRYLEGFLPVCRWCRKIKVGNEWMSVSTYLTEYEEEAASFGLCPNCAEKRKAIEAQVRAGAEERRDRGHP